MGELEQINGWLRPVLWGWPVLCLILLAGLLFSVRLRFFSVTHSRMWLRQTVGSLFCRKKGQGGSGLSPFQALTTALAGSIGTGNIVGVATALTLGGPGAIFWMWVSALLGMMTIFAETVLGMKYRRRDGAGRWRCTICEMDGAAGRWRLSLPGRVCSRRSGWAIWRSRTPWAVSSRKRWASRPC